MYLAPPTALQGKTLTKSEPAFQAAITSLGVSAPAKITVPCDRASFTVSGSRPGLARNCAPASRHRRAVWTSSTVPAPMSMFAPRCLTRFRIVSIAPGTVSVISTIGIPPRETASAAKHRDDAHLDNSLKHFGSVHLFPGWAFGLSRDTRLGPFDQLKHFLHRHHRVVAGR